MLRELAVSDLEKEYSAGDRVCLDAEGCRDCSYCCEHVGRSILLDPYDIFSLCRGLGRSYEELLEEKLLEVHIADGLMLPNLRMQGESGCGFLNAEKRCSIHRFRPGFCRLFPLARVFREEGFYYIVQSAQCRKELVGEVEIAQWIGQEEMERYDAFVQDWHDFRKQLSAAIPGISIKRQQMLGRYLLRKFYLEPYRSGDFFAEYRARRAAAGEGIKKLL